MSDLVTGPSSSASPYLTGLEPNIRFTSLITTGDTVQGAAPLPDGGAWRFGGTPDGIGAFDSGNGTITILVNHELGAANGVVREHGSAGAYVDAIVIDSTTLKVIDAYDLGNTVYLDPDGDGTWVQQTTAFSRLCSADLADVNAYFYAGADGIAGTADDLGTRDRIFMNGEETGAEGRAFAWVATGPEARTVWELPALGKFSWENSVANPGSGAKTVVAGTDDSTPGQVYIYVGDKQATGNTVEKAGLADGILYGIKADGIGNNGTSPSTAENAQFVNGVPTTPTSGSFSLVALDGAETMTGAQLDAASDAAGVTEWWRPEDSAWDPTNPNRLYFATTASTSVVNGVTTPSRLWALDFADIANPELGGTFTMVLDGTEGHFMFDNLTVDANGQVWLVEDVGNNPRSGRIWTYDPVTDTSYEVGRHDIARFGDGPANSTQAGLVADVPATFPFTRDEEASGIVDVTHLLGDADTQAFLIDDQAHYSIVNDPRFSSDPVAQARAGQELVEGGQLLVMYVDAVKNGDRFDNEVRGSYAAEQLFGRGGNDLILAGSGDDTIYGGNGNDTIVGGRGADEIRGGAGADVILYNAASEGGDTIFGFVAGTDKIAVSAAGFGGGLTTSAGGFLIASQFVANAAGTATLANGQFIYDTDDRVLLWDADGTGAGAAVVVAEFANNPRLVATDITVIA